MRFLKIIFCFVVFISFRAEAMGLLRDDEIEDALYELSAPLFKTAKVTDIKIFVLNDPSVNAFVTPDHIMFLHSGLLTRFKDPEAILGVMAHEIGHVTGRHLARLTEKSNKLQKMMIMNIIAGTAGIFSGAPLLGMPLILGGAHVSERNNLKFSRENEEAADQAAARYLDNVGVSTGGVLDVLSYLNNMESMGAGKINPYTRSHPLSLKRIDFFRNKVKNTKIEKANITNSVVEKYERAILKLESYLGDPKRVLKKHIGGKTTNDIYATAIAYYKMHDFNNTIKNINQLIEREKHNPYFLELKAQTLLEHGKLSESLENYREALKYKNSLLLRVGAATASMNIADTLQYKEAKEKYYNEAISYLEYVLSKEPENIIALKQISVCYGKMNRLGEAFLALAEISYYTQDKDNIEHYTKLALSHLKPDSAAYHKALDLQLGLK